MHVLTFYIGFFSLQVSMYWLDTSILLPQQYQCIDTFFKVSKCINRFFNVPIEMYRYINISIPSTSSLCHETNHAKYYQKAMLFIIRRKTERNDIIRKEIQVEEITYR